MSYESPAIYILCNNLETLNTLAKKLKKKALIKGGKTLFQSQVYTVKEYINEIGVIKKNAFCTCLYLLSESDVQNFTATLLEDIKRQNSSGPIYYCLRFLEPEDAIRLAQYDDITFATMKEL